MKRILSLLTLVLITYGCNNKSSFTVEGVIKDKSKKYIYINRLDVATPVLIDSAKISRKGRFSLRIKAAEADFYQLGSSASDFITLLGEPGEKIKLVFEGKNLFEHYTVTGSAGSEKLRILDKDLADTKRKLDSLSTLYSKASGEPGFDIRKPLLEEQFNNLIREQRKKNITFIISNTGSLASIKALYQKINPETYVLYDPKDLQFLKIVTDSLTLHYPNSKHVQALARDFTKEMNQMYVNQIGQITKDLPQTKLDPVLINSDGKRIALSSLRGKYVLLTFWSLLSKECVAENLQLKEFYKLYNRKGFEIYQINLDQKEEDWKTAVKFDELPWISTKEDDPNNPVYAKIFNVQTLPTNYLFDKDGKIIGSNLHGKSLQIKLDQLFNKQ
jgi:thiol-disulfide isomerase/thioredoxin